jgi:hypothetical protein
LELGRNRWAVALIFRRGGFSIWSMKSKQLANVLIKIIGLYVCLCAIPGFISGVLAIFASALGVPKMDERMFGVISYSIGNVVQAAIGIFLIVKSRNLAEFWFKNEDE